MKAFRIMVNRSVTWADWDEELLAIELQELNASDFDLSLTGFDPREIDGLLAIPEEEEANAVPPRAGESGVSAGRLCGSAESTGSSAATRPARKLWRDFWEIANRS